ncbi:MAG: NmrA family NAD(P)-binding protein [Candidatus Korobacteraceae bacterium]
MFVVTGASGHTGSVVADNLLAAGKKVRAIGRSAERLQRLVHKGAEPFVASLTDSEALTRAFRGVRAVYVMIPPNYSASDVRADQQAVTEAIASALERAAVTHAVTLSSVGADKAEGTGPVVGLHRLEQRLNRIAGLNVLHLRAGYFMENTLGQVGIIHQTGTAIGPLEPNLRFPMIATRDIGDAAADALLKLEFNSHETRELLGPNDITMTEVAAILAKAIGKPDLKYVHAPDDKVRDAMLQMGMSEDLVAQLLEMSHAMNAGHMKPLEPRSARNSTSTSFATFARQEFVPQYKGKAAA